MAVFVHLTASRNLTSIRRGGICVVKKRWRPRGVYAMPVTPNFYVSHQWLRELKRHGGGTIAGVYFRIPDDERVEVGHYNSLHVAMTAAQAVGLILSCGARDAPKTRTKSKPRAEAEQPDSAAGFEVIVPRKIERSEILRIKSLPQVIGWRYSPGSHGRPPCVCMCCERGTYGTRKLLRVVEEAEALGKPTKVIVFGREEDSFRRVKRLRERARKAPPK